MEEEFMNPTTTRWTLGILAALVIALLLFLWNRGDQKQPPAKSAVATEPAAQKPAEPRAEGPLTASVSVLFEFDQSGLRPAESAKLDELAAGVKGRAFDRLNAIGHADRIGGDTYNLQLSKRRAEAVRAYLIGKGIDAGRIVAEAMGEGMAVTAEACKNMGPERRTNQKLIECLQRDRRVEVTVGAAR
jgi:OOP family OmpA-OmpF porin